MMPDVATTTPDSAQHLDTWRGWAMAAATFVSTFTVFGVAYSFGAFFESMSDEFGSGKGLTALFFSLTTFLYFVLGLWTGRWSDRVGPRPVLLVGAGALGAGLLVTSVASTIWIGLLTYSTGVGVAVACSYVPMVAAVGGWFIRQRTAALGVAVAGIGAGTLVMAPTANWLIDQHGWRVAYRVFAVGGVLLLTGCAVVARRPPIDTQAAPPPPLRTLAGDHAFRLLYGSSLLMSLALFVPFVFLAAYSEDEGISSGRGAILVGLIGGASILGRLALGTLAPRVGLVRLYQACFATMGLSFLLWLEAGDRYAVLVTFTIVLGVAYGGFIALSPAVCAMAYATTGLGGVLGALYTAAGIGGLFGPPIAGAVIDASGSYRPAIIAATGLTFAAFAVLTRLRT